MKQLISCIFYANEEERLKRRIDARPRHDHSMGQTQWEWEFEVDLGVERRRDGEIDRFLIFFFSTLIKTSTHLSYFWIRNRNSIAFGLLYWMNIKKPKYTHFISLNGARKSLTQGVCAVCAQHAICYISVCLSMQMSD